MTIPVSDKANVTGDFPLEDFGMLTEDHLALRDTLRDFAQKELAPGEAQRDRSGQFPWEAVKKLSEMGVMGICTPEEYGGAGLDSVSSCIAVEELSRASGSAGVIVSVQNSLVQDPIIKHGTEQQKQRYLPKLATGEWIGCFSLTEADSGSDAGAMRCRAELKGDGWHIKGTKNFVTNGGEASFCVMFCQSDPDSPRRRSSAFLVPMDTPGVEVGKHEDKLGIRSSSTVELIFNDAVLPQDALLGERGMGMKVAIFAIDGGRLGIAAQALGIAEACLDESARYAAQRRQFGRPIADFQAIQWKLANMAVDIQASRCLTYRGAWLKDQGANFLPYACMAKVVASEAASRAANHAIQIFGGYGYIRDYPVERLLRDAKITELYEGTSEMQRLTIAKCLRDCPEMVREV